MVHISEGMCRQCGWDKIKLKCKICGEIISKGYPRLLAHATAHYTSAEILYNGEADENIIFINFESSKNSNEILSENGHDCGLRCKICRNHFTFKKEEIITFSKLIDHIKSHYIDRDLVKKEWIAKDMIHLNYDSVIQVNDKSIHRNSSITYQYFGHTWSIPGVNKPD
jgi:hypothetical protein